MAHETVLAEIDSVLAAIRNAAAHGKFGEYDENQVRQMITGIRDFISKYPA